MRMSCALAPRLCCASAFGCSIVRFVCVVCVRASVLCVYLGFWLLFCVICVINMWVLVRKIVCVVCMCVCMCRCFMRIFWLLALRFVLCVYVSTGVLNCTIVCVVCVCVACVVCVVCVACVAFVVCVCVVCVCVCAVYLCRVVSLLLCLVVMC